MDPDTRLAQRALAAIEQVGVDGRLVGSGEHPTAIHLEVSRAGRSHRYVGLISRVVRPSTIARVAEQVRSLPTGSPAMVLCEHVSSDTADLLRRRGIQFIDTAGNAYLEADDLLISIVGRRPAAPVHPVERVRLGAAAWQVAFVLLRDKDAADLSVRALGERAGVSHGAAASALHAFDRRGWIRDLGRAGRPVIDPAAFISAWLMGFTDRLSPKLELARAVSPGSPSPSAWASSVAEHLSPEEGLLGGEAAAELSIHEIRGSTASIYVRRWDANTMRRLRLAPSAGGAILVRSAFAPSMQDTDDSRLVDKLIVLAELSAIPDERLDSTRAALRAKVVSRAAR